MWAAGARQWQQQQQAEQRQVADSLAADVQRIQNGNELKRWLKEQGRAFKAASE